MPLLIRSALFMHVNLFGFSSPAQETTLTWTTRHSTSPRFRRRNAKNTLYSRGRVERGRRDLPPCARGELGVLVLVLVSPFLVLGCLFVIQVFEQWALGDLPPAVVPPPALAVSGIVEAELATRTRSPQPGEAIAQLRLSATAIPASFSGRPGQHRAAAPSSRPLGAA
jgi:hypothetical protein